MLHKYSFDFVLLATCLFGVHYGYTGRYIGPRSLWVLTIFNLILNITVAFLLFKEFYIGKNDEIIRLYFWYNVVDLCTTIHFTMKSQLRYLFRRNELAMIVDQLATLSRSSTWTGDISGCVARVLLYILSGVVYQILYAHRGEYQSSILLLISFHWSHYVPSVFAEFLGQAMMLFQHEYRVLSETARDIAACQNFSPEERKEQLRDMNRRHVSLTNIANAFARLTGTDTLILIETEKILCLLFLFIRVDNYLRNPVNGWDEFIEVIFYTYRFERITHCCFRGHRLSVEFDNFASSLSGINPLDLEDEDSLLEFQIFQKQVNLRKLHFDCNRFFELNTKRIFWIIKDLITSTIICIQVSRVIVETPATSNDTNHLR